MIPMLLGVSLLAFLLLQLSPGDPLAAQRSNPQVPEDLVRQIERQYGFDKPIPQQYAMWLGNVLRGDLGYSFKYKRPVAEVLRERLAATLLLSRFITVFSSRRAPAAAM